MEKNQCRYCGHFHGVRCPEVKAIEYFPDGTVKRVEYVTPTDLMPIFSSSPLPILPPWEPMSVATANPMSVAIANMMVYGIAP